MSENLSHVDILETAAEIDRLYEVRDKAERSSFQMRRTVQRADDDISVRLDDLSFLEPATLAEALVLSTRLSAAVIGSTFPDDGEHRDQVDRLIRNLERGLIRLVGRDVSTLPRWVREEAERSLGIDRLADDNVEVAANGASAHN